MDLKRRVAKLETAAVSQGHQGPVISDEDRAIMQRIIDNMYADPERHAKCIAIFEQAGERLAAQANESRHG